MTLTSIRIDMPKDETAALMAVLTAGGAQDVTLQAREGRTPGNHYGQIIFGLDVTAASCGSCGK